MQPIIIIFSEFEDRPLLLKVPDHIERDLAISCDGLTMNASSMTEQQADFIAELSDASAQGLWDTVPTGCALSGIFVNIGWAP
jgi:hypothetical protein